jgi:hypothetical protein
MSLKRVLLFLTLFLGQREFVSPPVFPVKGPKLGVLPSFTHAIVTFLAACLTFTVTLFSAHNFSLSHRIVIVTLTYHYIS